MISGQSESLEVPSVEPVAEDVTGFNLHAEIKKAIVLLTPNIKDSVINTYALKEIKKREEAIMAAIDKLDAAKSEVKKAEKPENELFDGFGKPLPQTFSKLQLENIKKAKENLAKIESAIETALVQNDYSKVLALK